MLSLSFICTLLHASNRLLLLFSTQLSQKNKVLPCFNFTLPAKICRVVLSSVLSRVSLSAPIISTRDVSSLTGSWALSMQVIVSSPIVKQRLRKALRCLMAGVGEGCLFCRGAQRSALIFLSKYRHLNITFRVCT